MLVGGARAGLLTRPRTATVLLYLHGWCLGADASAGTAAATATAVTGTGS